ADDVDQLSVLERIVHEVSVMAEPQMHEWLAKLLGHGVRRYNRTPSGAVATRRRLTAIQACRNARPNAIGADHCDGLFVEDLHAALAQHADAVDVSGEILDPDTKLERDIKFASHGVGESRLQITAMHRPIRRA